MTTSLRLILSALILGAAVWLWQAGLLFNEPQVIVTWSTESEVETAGFHVYRADTEDGSYERVSERLIPSGGDPFSGDEYTFVDQDVEAGGAYFYQLEELETTGNFTRLPDTVRAEAGAEPRWLWVAALAMPLLLVWLLPERARRQGQTTPEPRG